MPKKNQKKLTNVPKRAPLPPSYRTQAADGSFKQAIHISPAQDVNETPLFYHIGDLPHVPTPFPTPPCSFPMLLCFAPAPTNTAL